MKEHLDVIPSFFSVVTPTSVIQHIGSRHVSVIPSGLVRCETKRSESFDPSQIRTQSDIPVPMPVGPFVAD